MKKNVQLLFIAICFQTLAFAGPIRPHYHHKLQRSSSPKQIKIELPPQQLKQLLHNSQLRDLQQATNLNSLKIDELRLQLTPPAIPQPGFISRWGDRIGTVLGYGMALGSYVQMALMFKQIVDSNSPEQRARRAHARREQQLAQYSEKLATIGNALQKLQQEAPAVGSKGYEEYLESLDSKKRLYSIIEQKYDQLLIKHEIICNENKAQRYHLAKQHEQPAHLSKLQN